MPLSMWLKIAAGAVVGFVIGSFAAPGLTLWMTIGVLAGYSVEASVRRARARTIDRDGRDD